MIKLIACDLDGTLLNEQHQLSKKSKELLAQLPAYDVQFMAATGRMFDSVIHLFDELLPNCEYLLLNGAMISDSLGNTLKEHAMCKEDILKVHAIFQEMDLCYHMYTSQGTVTMDIERARNEFLQHIRQQGQSEEAIQQMLKDTNFCRYEREIQDLNTFLKEAVTIYKMEAYGCDRALLEQARAQLLQLSSIAVTNSIEDNIEITDLGAQKGLALQQFCQEQGIAKEEVLVIGDSLNDLSMLQLFPHSVAMKNGRSVVHKAATYISTYTNDEDGVAHILQGVINSLSILGN